MGYWVIGFGNITFGKKQDGKLIDELCDRMEHDEDFSEVVQYSQQEIGFQMGGNKGLNYEELEKIKNWLFEKKLEFEITVGEYVESQDNYYFDSKEEIE